MRPGQAPTLTVFHTCSEQHLSTSSAYVTGVTNTTMQKLVTKETKHACKGQDALHTVIQERAGCVYTRSTKSNEVPENMFKTVSCSMICCKRAICARQRSSTLCTAAQVCMLAGYQAHLLHHNQAHHSRPVWVLSLSKLASFMLLSAQAQQPFLHAASVQTTATRAMQLLALL